MLQRQFRVHVLEPSVFFFQLTQAANVGGFHAAVLCLPLVVAGVADFVFATNVSDGLARLDGFQDGDDLRLAEFALSHSASWRHTRPETSSFQWPGFKGGLQTFCEPTEHPSRYNSALVRGYLPQSLSSDNCKSHHWVFL